MGALMRHYLRVSYEKQNKVKIANYIDCEAHRELLSQSMANAYKEKTQ